MSTIVVGFDGREGGRDALALALAISDADAELLVGAALPYEPLPVIDSGGYDRALADHFDALFGEVERELTEREFARRELRDSSPARALSELAEAEGADLVVLGSTHRGKLGRVYPGSVGERLLNGAPCAVAVAPRGIADREHVGLETIGVAYDGTPESHLALTEAERLRDQFDSSLRVITVVPHPETISKQLSHTAPELAGAARELLGTSAYSEALHRYFREVLDAGVAKLGGHGDVDAVLDEGDPAAALAARGVELDLLVIGSRGYGPLRRVLLGGVSAELMRTAPCPVVVAPRAAS
jgi:nucleotide-binding universal stress UspA family protein